jgi:hypothetical protein
MRLTLSVAVLVALAGCVKSPPPLAKVAGTVTLGGKPLRQGNIRFEPADTTNGAAISAPIVDGMYSAPAVPHGSYRVSFSSADATPTVPGGRVDSTFNAPDPKAEAKKDPIPERYRKPSLSADITGDNPGLNFDLKAD